MKMFLSLALAMLTSATTMPLEDDGVVRVEDIAFALVLDQTQFNVDLPVSGLFTGTPYVALAVMHSDTTVSVYDLNGLQGYDAVFPPLAYDLHYPAGGTTFKTCYLNRASIQRWVETNCAGMTLQACAQKHLNATTEMQRIDPPHATNPTCP